jgi:hypothetical protein
MRTDPWVLRDAGEVVAPLMNVFRTYSLDIGGAVA